MKLKKILVLFSLLFVFVLVGCSKNVEIKDSSGSTTTIKAKYSFHLENLENWKLVFGDDGYIYQTQTGGGAIIKTTLTWKKHDNFIFANDGQSTRIIYELIENGNYLIVMNYSYNQFYVKD